MECEIDDYPCIWAEIPDEILDRTNRVALVAAALMREVQDLETVAEFLSEEGGLAELSWGDAALRFRLRGSRPVWIPLPFDPGNPRRGGGSEDLGSIPSLTAAMLASPLSAQPQTGPQANKIAAAEIGRGKKASILAPFYYHIGKETTDVYREFARSPNYSSKKGGKVEFGANLLRQHENAAFTHKDAGTMAVSGQVTIADFMNWKDYNFVYLATHGYADCPTDTFDPQDRAQYAKRVGELLPQVSTGKCHTVISVRELPAGGQDLLGRARPERDRFANREWQLPGVDVVYKTVATPHPGLSPTEARWCVNESNPSATAPGTTKPCFQHEDVPTEVAVTSEFFRKHYGGGLNDIVIFLAVCEAMWVKDLKEALAPQGNHDVAVFGFNRAVRDDQARILGTKAVKLFLDPGYSNKEVLEELEALARRETIPHFEGVVRGRGGAAPLTPEILESSSNPTHARDVVELLDPETGKELKDGATVRVRGCPGDGEDDRLEVHPVVVGVNDPADLLGTRLRVAVGGTEPSRSYQPDQLLEEGKYVWLETVDLGRDATEGEEIVDLEVRGELPEDGRSIWRYQDIRLKADGPCPCTFTATLSGDTYKGSVKGDWAVFSTRGQATIMGYSGGGAEALEDLANVGRFAQGLRGGDDETTQRLLDMLQRKADEAQEVTPGGTLGINLVEGGRDQQPAGGLAGAFKIDLLAEGSIEAGFSGSLPVKRAAVHSGEYAEEGFAPMLFVFNRELDGNPGEVSLTVHDYDGTWMRGTITGDLAGITAKNNYTQRTRLQFTAEFDAGVFNPLRMENACLVALAMQQGED